MFHPDLDVAALGLVFLLGLRHGLDPDHIAIVDNLTFGAHERRPGLAPWAGTWFALGHSISVAAVAIGVTLLAGLIAFPKWIGGLFDWLVIVLLVLVGSLNLAALLRRGSYRPVGWRQALFRGRLQSATSPLSILVIGMVFGLVFDTATQAVAWGTAASSGQGIPGALAIAAAFAVGMVITDTADSQIVARLLRRGDDPAQVGRYRRTLGWTIVGLSFGMAALALTAMLTPQAEIPDAAMTALGGTFALAVVLVFLIERRRSARTS